MSTLKGRDDCTDIILDFIAGGIWGDKFGNPSGESNGNYNAVIGHVNGYKGTVLADLTLADIYDLMSELLAAGEPSTAVGRYQIIRRTLQTLQSKRGLSAGDKFTEAVQDELAVALLIGRGYPAWWRGDLTDTEFAHNLSCEWASLPDPAHGGKSHYDGVGPNHSSTTVAHVMAMLAAARAAQG